MLRTTVVLLALNVAVAISQLCCTPPQWEGMEGFTVGYVERGMKKKMEGYAKVSYDANNLKFAADTHVFVGRKGIQSKVIMDFQKKKQYTIFKKYCKVTKIKTRFQKACIPDGSESFPAYFGIGNDGLDVDMYNIKRTPVPNIQISSTVTRRGCIPVGETISGEINKVSFMEVIGFFNITAGIRNPDIFNPPASCKQSFDNQTLKYVPYHVKRMQTKISHFGF